jgi:hypothetical protein
MQGARWLGAAWMETAARLKSGASPTKVLPAPPPPNTGSRSRLLSKSLTSVLARSSFIASGTGSSSASGILSHCSSFKAASCSGSNPDLPRALADLTHRAGSLWLEPDKARASPLSASVNAASRSTALFLRIFPALLTPVCRPHYRDATSRPMESASPQCLRYRSRKASSGALMRSCRFPPEA